MQVFSEQSVDLRYFRERLDRNKGTYVDQPKIRDALWKLYDEVIITDQVIWCSIDEPEEIPLPSPQFIHTIELDKYDIVAILDGFVWNHIIGNNKCIPPDEHERMRFKSILRNNQCFKEELTQLENEYIKKHLPNDLWGNVIGGDIHCRMPQILIKWPFESANIVKVKRIQKQENGLG